jgi:hypothetical protein
MANLGHRISGYDSATDHSGVPQEAPPPEVRDENLKEMPRNCHIRVCANDCQL